MKNNLNHLKSQILTLRPDPTILIEIVQKRMPFGRFQGTLICDLPVEYLLWMKERGMPSGRLGELMENVLEMKTQDLYYLIAELKARYTGRPIQSNMDKDDN